MKTTLAASSLAVALLAAQPGLAQDAPEGVTSERAVPQLRCARSDLEGPWLMLFTLADNTRVGCGFSILKTGGIRAGFCQASGGGGNAAGVFTGKLTLFDECQISGAVRLPGVGATQMTAQLSGDKTIITGIVGSDAEFIPITATRWPSRPVQ
jgi:hypothetical protein